MSVLINVQYSRTVLIIFSFLIQTVGSCIFTVLHGMQTLSSDENSFCPSVKHVICDKTKESCAHILIPHERSFTLAL